MSIVFQIPKIFPDSQVFKNSRKNQKIKNSPLKHSIGAKKVERERESTSSRNLMAHPLRFHLLLLIPTNRKTHGRRREEVQNILPARRCTCATCQIFNFSLGRESVWKGEGAREVMRHWGRWEERASFWEGRTGKDKQILELAEISGLRMLFKGKEKRVRHGTTNNFWKKEWNSGSWETGKKFFFLDFHGISKNS